MEKEIFIKYPIIHKFKSGEGKLGINDGVFDCLALAYSLSLYSDKYSENFNSKYYNFIYYLYKNMHVDGLNKREQRDLHFSETEMRIPAQTSQFFKKIYNLKNKLNNIYYSHDGYANTKDKMIRCIMQFDKSLDIDTATKIFNTYYTLLLGGLLKRGYGKISDRAISNILLFRLMQRKNKNVDLDSKNNYARYVALRYFALAVDSFNNYSADLSSDSLSRNLNEHRRGINEDNCLIRIGITKDDDLEKAYNLYNNIDLRFNRLLNRRDYSSKIGKLSKKTKIEGQLTYFLINYVRPWFEINGAYTVIVPNNQCYLYIVIQEEEVYKKFLDGLQYLSYYANDTFKDDLKDTPILIKPLFVPPFESDNSDCKTFKESLNLRDAVLYDKRRFLSGCITKMEKASAKCKPAQYKKIAIQS